MGSSVPKIIDKIGKSEDYALILIVILGLASFAAKELGLSVATGAFLAGVLVAESKSANVARVITTPLRDMFSNIFYINRSSHWLISYSYAHCSRNVTYSDIICFKVLDN